MTGKHTQNNTTGVCLRSVWRSATFHQQHNQYGPFFNAFVFICGKSDRPVEWSSWTGKFKVLKHHTEHQDTSVIVMIITLLLLLLLLLL